MQIALWCIGTYLAIGAVVAVIAWQPEQGGWLWDALLWPLTVYSILAP